MAWRPGGEERRESGEEVVEPLTGVGGCVNHRGHDLVLESAAESSAPSGEGQQGGFEVVDVGEGEGRVSGGGGDGYGEVPAGALSAVLAQAAVGVVGLADVDGVAARVAAVVKEVDGGEGPEAGAMAVEVAFGDPMVGDVAGFHRDKGFFAKLGR